MNAIHSTLLASAARVTRLGAYDAGKAGWKVDDNGVVVLRDGNPVYVQSDGSEGTIDPSVISRLNAEAKNHRTRAEKAEAALKIFEGLDPEIARKAVETVSKIDAKALIDAGEVDKVRSEVAASYTTQIQERDKSIEGLNGRINQMTLEGGFSRSKFIQDRVAVPAEMFQATFASHFKVEDGVVIPYAKDGNKIYSKRNIGQVADMDEALELIVEQYPHRDSILKAATGGGTGNTGGGGQRGGSRTVNRTEFDALPPAKQAEMAALARTGEVSIVD
jgi:hypothetical protein